jgi:hypothetical protein
MSINKKKSINDDPNDSNNSDDIDSDCSSNISQYDKNKIDDIVSQDYIKNVVSDKLIKYIKFNMLISEKQKQHREEMKALKNVKTDMEKFLCDYLEKIDEEYFNIGTKTRITKKTSVTKSTIKKEDIQKNLVSKLAEHEIVSDPVKANLFAEQVMLSIEKTRKIKKRTYLKTGKTPKNANKNNNKKENK